MSPADYMASEGLTSTAWAERLGVSQSHLWQVANGRKPAGRQLALAIVRDTDGAVSLEDVFAAYAPDPTPGEGAAA